MRGRRTSTTRRRRQRRRRQQQQNTTQQQQRLGCVSSFGMSGTNAHVVVGEAPQTQLKQEKGEGVQHAKGGVLLCILSAKSEGALHELARRYAAHIGQAGVEEEEKEANIVAMCAAAAMCRAHLSQQRAAVTVTMIAGREALQAKLNELAEGGGGGGGGRRSEAAAAAAAATADRDRARDRDNDTEATGSMWRRCRIPFHRPRIAI